MPEHAQHDVHSGAAVLDIGENIGALIIHCRPELHGQKIEVSPRERLWERVHTDVLERRINGEPVFAALFLALDAGAYVVWNYRNEQIGEVTITGGQVAELDWRPVQL